MAIRPMDRMRKLFARATVVLTAIAAAWAESQIVRPYEASSAFVPHNVIDEQVLAALQKQGIRPAHLCSDEVFVRRVYLDVIGTLPEAASVRAFLADRNPMKRAELIESLMQRGEFADYWAMKWCDLLRVKAEFPINLWPNAVQAYHRWIRDAIRQNMPYDRFVRELLTASGSNFRVPQVNFYRAVQGHDPSAIASATALTFMGVRIQTQTGDSHPFSSKQDNQQAKVGLPKTGDCPQFDHLDMFFSRIAYKTTAEWKEEIVYLDPTPAEPLDVVFPDGVAMRIEPGNDPRIVFADWLITPGNPWFARNIVNRVWYWLMGRGIIHEPDDIRPDNPPSNPELLAVLEKELVKADYDLRHIYRLILKSRTYQQSPIPQTDTPEAEALFAYYPVRRLDAEVLIDALSYIAGIGEKYSSLIPEPYTFIPANQRSIALADGSITSPFLETFGRPARDTGLESERNNQPTDAQRLHLLNSTHVRQKIERSERLQRVIRDARGNPRNAIEGIYLCILSRYPTPAEVAEVQKYAQAGALNPSQAAQDLAWALINSKEFLYRH